MRGKSCCFFIFWDFDERGVWSHPDLKCTVSCQRRQRVPVQSTCHEHSVSSLGTQHSFSQTRTAASEQHVLQTGISLNLLSFSSFKLHCGFFFCSLWSGKDASESQSNRIKITSNNLMQSNLYRFVFFISLHGFLSLRNAVAVTIPSSSVQL